MKEEDALAQLITEIEAATGLTDDVRTAGGDQDIDPPEVIIEWQASRLPQYGGSNNFAAYTQTGGNDDGIEYHLYYRVEAECVIRDYDELDAHAILNSLQDAFSPYEYDANAFDADTAQWEVGSDSPRHNPIMEPDWYEIAVPLRFVLLRRTTEDKDTLTTITDGVEIDPDLEDGEITIS